MRILHIVASYKPAYIYGGPIYSVSALCEGLASVGHDVEVYTTDAAGKENLNVVIGEPLEVEGVKVTYFHRLTKDHSQFTPSLIGQLVRYRKKFDVIHIHSWWNLVSVLSAVVCQMSGAHVIISPRGTMGDYAFSKSKSSVKAIFHGYIGKKMLNQLTFHVTSDKEKSEVKHRVSPRQIVKIPNILSLPEYDTLKSTAGAEISEEDKEELRLIYIGRIHHKKNLELLFEVMADVKAPNCTIDIIGEGEEKYINSLKRLSDGLGRRVRWLGGVYGDEKYELIKRADALVLLSHSENFANVVLESLSQGVPVLLSPQVGMSEFVHEHDLGWVVDLKKDVGVEALISLADDTDKRARIRREAPTLVAKYFGRPALIEQYEGMYLSA